MIDEKRAGASYVINFYADVEQLIGFYAQYENLLIEIFSKHGNNPNPADLSDEEQASSLHANNVIRQMSISTYIKYAALAGRIRGNDTEKMKALIARIKSKPVIEAADIETYVIELNSFLASNIMNSLLANSMEMIQDVYGTPTGQGNSNATQ